MIIHGDCLTVLRAVADNTFDSIVTDPPYGLTANKKGGAGVNLESPYGRARIGTGNGPGGFMGHKWDSDVPSVEIWAECLRVLKPGGHLLAFAGTRTQHRMAVRIEDAGFEIRDMIAWVYGSGFPKSLDVSKAIDKVAGADPSDPLVTDAAHQWQGWGTALKPALEPITVARKPLSGGTVAANVLEHGTGALNIDGCRVGTSKDVLASASKTPNAIYGAGMTSMTGGTESSGFNPNVGRWPANLIHDGSDEVLAAFPQAPGQMGRVGPDHGAKKSVGVYGDFGPRDDFHPRQESDKSAARFFYCAKASKKDRDDGLDHLPEMKSSVGDNRPGGDFNERLGKTPGVRRNHHPTVKPTDLMRYLCRLVTPPGGLVLDPFAGSGSTGKAALLEGFNFIGIERESHYVEIANARIAKVISK